LFRIETSFAGHPKSDSDTYTVRKLAQAPTVNQSINAVIKEAGFNERFRIKALNK
jgi:hypothetical protein